VITADEYKKAKEGDPEAIEKLCIATWEPLYRFIYYKVQNREEAEDITQETYVKTLNYLQRNKIPQERLLGFLKTVSLNVIRDRWRKKKRGGVFLDFLEINSEERVREDQQNEIAQRLMLEAALAKLSREQQNILRLRIIQGYSAAEAAKLVGKTESAVRTAQYRALQALAQILDEQDPERNERRESVE